MAGKAKAAENRTKSKEKIVVTSALPYANGSIHLGHMVEYVQTDIFVRFLKLTGHDAIYVCADDTHGTPIQVNAQKQGITPEQLIAKYHDEHTKDFKDFHIDFDSYYTTNSKENREYADLFFSKMKERGYIYQKEIEQMYDPEAKQFLPDRFVKGECPKCGAKDQYGDVCEQCNSTYEATELINPYSVISGKKPILKSSTHYFFRLTAFSDRLEKWLNENKKLQPEIRNSILTWIKEGLKDWCISRDAPYFGFTIKDDPKKYYYVWLDAPIGYISSTKNYCNHHKEKNVTVDDYWKSPDGKAIHVIGKDIIYFHYLFWPAMLMAAEFNLPDYLITHGFLTVNGEKMSKSRGTFITARKYLETLDPIYLRFYYAYNLTRKMSDINLDVKDFTERINTELVANIANFCYRVLSFAEANLDGTLSDARDAKIEKEIRDHVLNIKGHYANFETREAIKEIFAISAIGNKYFQENQPWKVVKVDKEKARDICTVCADIIKILAITLKPVIPTFSDNVEKQLNLKDLTFADIDTPLHKKLGKSFPLIHKIEPAQVQKVVGDDEEKKETATEAQKQFPLLLKVGVIEQIAEHPNAEKLYVLKVKTDRELQLVAGLRNFYTKEDLINRKIVVVSNLEPATLRGEKSEGMLLAASHSENGKEVVKILTSSAHPGDVITVGNLTNNHDIISYKDFQKVKLDVKAKNVFFETKELKAGSKSITVEAQDGAQIR